MSRRSRTVGGWDAGTYTILRMSGDEIYTLYELDAAAARAGENRAALAGSRPQATREARRRSETERLVRSTGEYPICIQTEVRAEASLTLAI